MPFTCANRSGFFEILIEMALGSNVVAVVVVVPVVVPVLVVVVPEPEPLDVPVDVEAVVVVDFFEPPCDAEAEPVVFVVLVAPPPVVLVLDGPCAVDPPPLGAVEPPPLGAVVPALGALPAPRPCAVAVVPNAAIAIADAAKSENLRMVWTPSGQEVVQEGCPPGAGGQAA